MAIGSRSLMQQVAAFITLHTNSHIRHGAVIEKSRYKHGCVVHFIMRRFAMESAMEPSDFVGAGCNVGDLRFQLLLLGVGLFQDE
jgi:hypothetical protein